MTPAKTIEILIQMMALGISFETLSFRETNYHYSVSKNMVPRKALFVVVTKLELGQLRKLVYKPKLLILLCF